MKRIVGCKLILTAFLTGIALCHVPSTARSTPTPYHIVLYGYGDVCTTKSYQEGQVHEISTGTVIGTVPPGSFTIYNANNQAIGYISPDA
jgi:hypothetical protein